MQRSPLDSTLKRLRLRQKDLVDAGLVSKRGAWLWCSGRSRPEPDRVAAIVDWLRTYDRRARPADVTAMQAPVPAGALGKAMRRLRVKHSALATWMGVSRQCVSQWVGGETRPTQANARQILAFLRIHDRNASMADVVAPRAK